MNLIRSLALAAVLAILLVACHADSHEHESITVPAHVAFFQTIAERCGDTYFGETVNPENPEHELYGAELKMTIASCTDEEIRIPFQVNDDRSRTWILTLSDEGLLFKHDHRYEDGTPHALTNYGGWANDEGSPVTQYFPADAETAELLPEAATNQWTMILDVENNQFIYYLERHELPRYRAVFSLN